MLFVGLIDLLPILIIEPPALVHMKYVVSHYHCFVRKILQSARYCMQVQYVEATSFLRDVTKSIYTFSFDPLVAA